MDYEQLLENLGGFGTYNIIVFVLLTYFTFQSALELQGTLLAFYTPKFTCNLPFNLSHSTSITNNFTNFTISTDQCSYRLDNSSNFIPCTSFSYDTSLLGSTIVTEFDLVCSQKGLVSTLQTIYFSGALLGFVVSNFADRLGRQKVIFAGMIWKMITSTAIPLLPGLTAVYIVPFLGGASNALTTQAAILSIELAPVRLRSIVAGTYWLPWSIGYMITPGIVYLGHHWRLIKLYLLIQFVVYIACFAIIPESPRWLLLKGRKQEAAKLLSRIARFNKKEFPVNCLDSLVCRDEKTGDIFQLFKYKWVFIKLVVCMLTNWALTCAYYGVMMDMSFAVDNIFVNVTLMGMVEIPSGIIAAFSSKWIGRKRSFTIQLITVVVIIITVPFLKQEVSAVIWTKAIIALLGKCLLCSAFCVFDIILPEVYPTSLRNGAFAITYLCSTMGLVVCPQIVALGDLLAHYVPAFIFAIQCVISIVLVNLLLPETKKTLLPETANEANRLRRGNEEKWNQWMEEGRGEKKELQPFVIVSSTSKEDKK